MVYMWEKRHAYKVFGGETEGKRPTLSLDLRWRMIFKRTLKKLDWRTDWINLAEDMDKWWAVTSKVVKLLLQLSIGSWVISLLC
jgi:hypothetical protein